MLTEAGARPSETTVVTPADFDDARAPMTVHLPGVQDRAQARRVTLPSWGRPIVAAALDVHLSRGRHMYHHPLAYDGKHHPGKASASASVSGNLKRLMRNAGLTDTSLAATSVPRWRIQTVAAQQGLEAAHRLLGDRGYNGLS